MKRNKTWYRGYKRGYKHGVHDGRNDVGDDTELMVAQLKRMVEWAEKSGRDNAAHYASLAAEELQYTR